MSAPKPLTVYDREICADLGKYGAYCKHLFIPGKRDVTKAQWDKDRVGMICTTSQGESDSEIEIEQACAMLSCTYEQRELLRQAKVRLKLVIDKARAARGVK